MDTYNNDLNKSKSMTRLNSVSPDLNKTNENLEETKALGLNLDGGKWRRWWRWIWIRNTQKGKDLNIFDKTDNIL